MLSISRVSLFTGKMHTMEIDITQEQYDNWAQKGWLIQNAMPNLSADEREFILTGITKAEWDEEFAGDNDNDGEENYEEGHS